MFFQKHYRLISVALILIYHLPYFILGHDASIRIHDNLDSTIAWLKIVLSFDRIFLEPTTMIPNIMNGLPLSSVWGVYHFSNIIFYIFDPFYGYVVSKLLVSFIAFFGMSKLLSRHLSCESKFTNEFVAVIFSLIPFWGIDVSVSGVPIILYAFLNIRLRKNVLTSFVLLSLIPFYSFLVTLAPFVLVLLICLITFDFIKFKKINFIFILAILLFNLFYILSHFPLFYNYFTINSFVSHRSEFSHNCLNLFDSVYQYLKIILVGNTHTLAYQLYFTPIVVYVFIHSILIKKRNGYLKLLFSFIVCTALLYILTAFCPTNKYYVPFFHKIPIGMRFYWLYPSLWYMLLAISIAYLSKVYKNLSSILILGLCCQLLFVISKHELITNRDKPSFKEFYSVEQFKEIKNTIHSFNKNSKVVSVGIHPAISQFNGLHTVDGYVCNYPVSYKHQFKKIIEKELTKNELINYKFNNWGSQCYIYSAELGTLYIDSKKSELPINLELDYQQLKNMGGDFIISSTKILEKKNLTLMKVFDKKEYFQTLYLYKVVNKLSI